MADRNDINDMVNDRINDPVVAEKTKEFIELMNKYKNESGGDPSSREAARDALKGKMRDLASAVKQSRTAEDREAVKAVIEIDSDESGTGPEKSGKKNRKEKREERRKNRRYFLLEKRIAASGSAAAGNIFTIVILLLAGICIGLVSLALGTTGYYDGALFAEYLTRPMVLLLNLFPPVMLIFFFYSIFNNSALSFLITGVITEGLAIINYFKLTLRDDPLKFADAFLISEAGDISKEYTISVDLPVILAAAFVIFGTVFMAFACRRKFRRRPVRILIPLLIAGVCILSVPFMYFSDTVYAEQGGSDVAGDWSEEGRYISRGSVYPFIYSIKEYFDIPDSSYDESELKEELENGIYEDIPADRKVAVISVMCEAFNDFSKFDEVEFNVDPYTAFHDVQSRSVTGQLITNIFGGGTVDTERGFLTGYSNLTKINGDSGTNSFVRYFSEQGYRTEGGHPGVEWFYDRDKINKSLGFDQYYFFENRYETESGFYIEDDIFFEDIMERYRNFRKDGTKPYFSFNVTYQNHGPYSDKNTYYEKDYIAEGRYSDKSLKILNNYFAGIEKTCENIANLAAYLDSLDEAVVLIIFGDHNPWLGNDESVYKELGINLELDDSTGFMNYYETPYIIYANQAAKDTLGNEFTGYGGDFSPCFLMQEFFSLAGWGGNEYMHKLSEARALTPVIHSGGFVFDNDRMAMSFSDNSTTEKLQAFLNFQRFFKLNFKGERSADKLAEGAGAILQHRSFVRSDKLDGAVSSSSDSKGQTAKKKTVTKKKTTSYRYYKRKTGGRTSSGGGTTPDSGDGGGGTTSGGGTTPGSGDGGGTTSGGGTTPDSGDGGGTTSGGGTTPDSGDGGGTTSGGGTGSGDGGGTTSGGGTTPGGSGSGSGGGTGGGSGSGSGGGSGSGSGGGSGGGTGGSSGSGSGAGTSSGGGTLKAPAPVPVSTPE